MARVYRNIALPVKIFGLELVDLAVVMMLFLVVFNVSDHLFINLVVLVLIAGGLRYAKKDKPQGYLVDLVAFVFTPRHRHVSLADSLRRYPAATASKGGGV